MTKEIISPLRWPQLLLVLLGLLLLWPAAVNGGPFLFPDTSAYIRGVDAAMVRLTDHRTEWSNADVLSIAKRSAAAATAAPKPAPNVTSSSQPPKPVLLGRSVFYGLLAYAGVLAGSLWFTIILQALLAGAVVIGFLRHFVDPRQERRFTAAAVAATVCVAATPLPWFVSMVMPDFLTGLLIVAAAAIVAGWRRETMAGRGFWIGVAAFAALAHSSHVLMLFLLAAAALGLSLVGRPSWRQGATALAASAVIGLLGEAAFSLAVFSATGTAPIRPPFVTARLVEDGPGVAFLQSHCADARFHLCRYRDRLPLSSDAFLWSKDRATGVFNTVPLQEQRALSAEQGAFALAVLMDRPLAVARSSSAAVIRQFAAWRLAEFNVEDGWNVEDMASRLPVAERTMLLNSRAAHRTMPTALPDLLIPFWTLIGLIAVAWTVWRRGSWTAGPYGLVLAAGWVADVILCGALSTPHDRYQTRAIWVLALAVVMILLTRSSARGDAVRQERQPVAI